MTDASRLIRAMQKVSAPKENHVVDMVTGTVTSVSPLKVRSDKLVLTQTFLVVGALCTQTPLWRGLQVGDLVYMIRFAQGQKYYIMQRKEGVV